MAGKAGQAEQTAGMAQVGQAVWTARVVRVARAHFLEDPAGNSKGKGAAIRVHANKHHLTPQLAQWASGQRSEGISSKPSYFPDPLHICRQQEPPCQSCPQRTPPLCSPSSVACHCRRFLITPRPWLLYFQEHMTSSPATPPLCCQLSNTFLHPSLLSPSGCPQTGLLTCAGALVREVRPTEEAAGNWA